LAFRFVNGASDLAGEQIACEFEQGQLTGGSGNRDGRGNQSGSDRTLDPGCRKFWNQKKNQQFVRKGVHLIRSVNRLSHRLSCHVNTWHEFGWQGSKLRNKKPEIHTHEIFGNQMECPAQHPVIWRHFSFVRAAFLNKMPLDLAGLLGKPAGQK